jgi:TolB-like protein
MSTEEAAPEPRPTAAPSATGAAFWNRVKAHKVVQWTIAYGVAAYTLLHIVEMVANALDWPHLVVRVVTLSLILGVPVAATLAWYHGHQALRRVSGPELAILTVLLIIAGGVLWFLGRPREHPSATPPLGEQTTGASSEAVSAPPDKSIAVLPFTDMSEKKDQQYFTDGLTDELIDKISQLPSIRVIARTSTFAVRGQTLDTIAIGRRLGAAYLLEGSVRTAGDRMRVTAQLIRAADGTHIWSRSYDISASDIFDLEDRISASATEMLRVTFNEGRLPTRPTPKNIDAYRLYRAAVNASTPAETATMLQEVLKIQPDYAVAWAALARSLMDQADYGFSLPANVYPRAHEAALQALRLDPASSDGRAALIHVLSNYDWNWQEAAVQADSALRLRPDDPAALVDKAWLTMALGRWSEAEWLLRHAMVRDPLSPGIQFSLGWLYTCQSRFIDAERAFTSSFPQGSAMFEGGTRSVFGRMLIAAHRPSDAIAEINKDPFDQYRLWGLTMAYHALGQRTESDAAMAELERRFAESAPNFIGWAHAYREELDQAFAWYERAYAAHSNGFMYIKCMPEMVKFRADPRYTALLRELKLPEQ